MKLIQKFLFKQIIWYGIGDDGKLVEYFSDNTAIFTFKDKAGNISTVRKDFYIDILVIKAALEYKIIISSIEFDFNSYFLKDYSIKILERLVEIMHKFSDYNILIIGYTDSIGDEEYNK